MALPNSVNANCVQIAEQICATMAAIVKEIMQQAHHTHTEHTANQLKNQAQPKQHQKLLICGYMEDEDCLCEVTDSIQSIYHDENDEDEVILDFKKEEGHQSPEVGTDEDFQTIIESPKSPIHQVCDYSLPENEFKGHNVANEVYSLPVSEFFSLLARNLVVRKFGKNQMERNIVDKVFDKMPEQNGYIPALNPKPPDEDPGAQFSKLVQTTSIANFETTRNKKIIYVGVNASDVNFSFDRYFSGNNKDIQSHQIPFNDGFEAVGLIVDVGDSVSHINIGSPAAIMSFGGYAEFTRVPLKHILPVARPDPEVVVMLTSGLTASISLEKAAQMDNGKLVFVTTAARGTGRFAVQLAKLAGNTIVTTCGGKEKAKLLKELGTDRVINYKAEDIKMVLKKEFPKGVDIIYESVGGQMFDLCLNVLAIYGLLVVIGMISQYQGEQGWKLLNYAGLCEKLLAKSQTLAGFFLNHYTHLWQHLLGRLVHLYSMGLLKVTLDPKRFLGLQSVADVVENLHSVTSVCVIGKCGVLMFLFTRLLGAWAYLGKLYRKEGEKQLAQQAFDQVRSIDPSLALPWVGMSVDSYSRDIKPDEAFEYCLWAIQILPLADYQIGIAKLALLSGNLSSSQVFGAIRQALQGAPHYPESHNLNGMVAEARLNYQTASNFYRIARCAICTLGRGSKSNLRDISINLARPLCKVENVVDAVLECDDLKKEGLLDSKGLQIYALSLWQLGKEELAMFVVRSLVSSILSLDRTSVVVSISFICKLLYHVSGQDSTIVSILKIPKGLFQSSKVSFRVSAIHALDQFNQLETVVTSSRCSLASTEEIAGMHFLIALAKLGKHGSEYGLGIQNGVNDLRKAIHLFPNSGLIRNLLSYLLLSSKEWNDFYVATRCFVICPSDCQKEIGLKSHILGADFSNDDGFELVRLASRCLKYEAHKRPNTKSFVTAFMSLQQETEVPLHELMGIPHGNAKSSEQLIGMFMPQEAFGGMLCRPR